MKNLMKFKHGDMVMCKHGHLHKVTSQNDEITTEGFGVYPKCQNGDGGIKWGVLIKSDIPVLATKLHLLFYRVEDDI